MGLLIDIDPDGLELLSDQRELFHRSVHARILVEQRNLFPGQYFSRQLTDAPAVGLLLQSRQPLIYLRINPHPDQAV